jgi:hypothetical protein
MAWRVHPRLAGGARAAAIAPWMPLLALAKVPGMRVLDDELHERLAGQPPGHHQVSALSIQMSGVSRFRPGT